MSIEVTQYERMVEPLDPDAKWLLTANKRLLALGTISSKAQVARSNRAGQAKIAKTLELPWSIAAH